MARERLVLDMESDDDDRDDMEKEDCRRVGEGAGEGKGQFPCLVEEVCVSGLSVVSGSGSPRLASVLNDLNDLNKPRQRLETGTDSARVGRLPRAALNPVDPRSLKPLEGAGLLAERGTVAPLNLHLGNDGIHEPGGRNGDNGYILARTGTSVLTDLTQVESIVHLIPLDCPLSSRSFLSSRPLPVFR